MTQTKQPPANPGRFTVLLEANDEWQLHRYMGVEAMAELLNPPTPHENIQLPPKAA